MCMVNTVQYFLLGASFMFSAVIAWLFWHRGSDMLSRLVVALMVVMALGFVKDAAVMSNLGTLPDLTLELATAVDVVAVPIYAFILFELCRPGKLTMKAICATESPFIILPLLLAIFHVPIFYYLDMGLAAALGLSMAIWTCLAIPKYHRHLKASFSYDENINLKWLQSILWAFFIILIVWMLSCVTYNPWLDVAYMILILILWIFICIFIYRHKSIVDELRPVASIHPTQVLTSESSRRDAFSRIKMLIEQEHIYLNPVLKLSDIASMANTNRTYASAYFSQEIGTTFFDHINGLRVKHALTLLQDTSKRIEDVAEESGFNSLRSFQRAFANIQGETPSGYRLRIQFRED